MIPIRVAKSQEDRFDEDRFDKVDIVLFVTSKRKVELACQRLSEINALRRELWSSVFVFWA